MCGIVGVFGKTIEKDRFIAARDKMSSRGPDDAGLYLSEQEEAAMGHRRLSIIDLTSDGHQPFCSDDGRYILVFNGEIYNYLELRDELNHVFRTKTDTEVLLASYIKWGEDCLDKLNGMFAFAIWDKKERKLFCARDQAGIKPFFYYFDGSSIFFASEIKVLLQLGVAAKPNLKIIYDYLYYGIYDHSQETFFDGVNCLAAGHKLVWTKNGGIKIAKYWDLTESKFDFHEMTASQIETKFFELLSDTVRLQFRSDVPVGINLSSGLDSNSLFYFAYNVLHYNSDIFTMCLREEEFDECDLLLGYLDEKMKHKWHPTSVSHDMILPSITKMNKIQDQPYGGIPTIAYGILNEQEKNSGVKVLLEAQGVDELIAGYRYYRDEYAKDLSCGRADYDSLHFSQDATKLVDNSVLNEDFLGPFRERKMSFAAPFKSRLLNAQYRDFKFTKLPRVLRFNDHASMAYGRELRVPFLDSRIMEFLFWLPVEFKIRGDEQKVILRDMMKSKMPRVVNAKPKKAFGAVQTVWFRKYYRGLVNEILNSTSFRNRGFWNVEILMDKINKFYLGEGDNSFFLWQCINLELWFRDFIDN